MEAVELVSRSARETERAAETAAEGLGPGDVVLVAGEVGTGKTTFVRGACRALKVTDPVTSPSFTIGRRYEGKLPVSHVDLFRLETLEGEEPALLDDYVDSESVTFVEWPDAAAAELEPERVALHVGLGHLGGDRRLLSVRGRPSLVESLQRVLGEGGEA